MNTRQLCVERFWITMLTVAFLCTLALSGCRGAQENNPSNAKRTTTEAPAQPRTTIEEENGALYVEGPRLTVILNTFPDVAEGWRWEAVSGTGVFRHLEAESPEQGAQAAQSWIFEAVVAGTAVMAFTPYDAQGEQSGPGYRFTFTVDADLTIESDAALFDLTGARLERAQGEDAIRMVEEIDEALMAALSGIVSAVYETPADSIEISVAPYTHGFSGVEAPVYTAQCADGRSCDLTVDDAGTFYINESAGTSRFKVILTGEIIAIGSPILAEPYFDPDGLANKLAGVLFDGQPAQPVDSDGLYIDHRVVDVYAVGKASGFIALDDGGEHLYCDPDGSGTYYRVVTLDEPPVFRVDRSRAVTVNIRESP